MGDELIVDTQPAMSLTADRYVIGRGDGCDILLPETDSGVSRRHALLERDEDGDWTFLDLSSRNGTLANGVRIQGRFSLRNGDRLQIGDSILVLNLTPSKPTLVTFVPDDGTFPDVAPFVEPVTTAPVTLAAPSLSGPPARPTAPPMDEAATIVADMAPPWAEIFNSGAAEPATPKPQNVVAQPLGITSALTGNKVSSECLASPGRRLAGYLIEIAIGALLAIGAFGSLLTGLAGAFTGILGMAGFKQHGIGLMSVGSGMILISLISGSLLIAYIVWDFMLMARGQTPGKKMLRMVVVSEDEMRVTFKTMFLRQIVLRGILLGIVLSAAGMIPVIGQAFSAVLAVLSNVWLLFDSNRQQWYDKICKTYVMDMRNAKAAYE